jgi:hypothetical protein
MKPGIGFWTWTSPSAAPVDTDFIEMSGVVVNRTQTTATVVEEQSGEGTVRHEINPRGRIN